ncbi:Imm30 family immunity protein [Bacillus licheniformis]|uniref:Imm30 family immunity protein n=1 Tax=Bacillus TaxID=1386 RepID=UPI002DBD4D17|nr:Imm30 family immunity protein [Bacillus licheniformis]MEC0715375.1 Imm30 family immunity protein [Bacillus licheniformis]
MDLKQELKKLYDNRFLENENEIQEFEESLAKVIDYGDVSAISELCLAFDDDTEQFEVMFGLVHGIERLYKNNIEEGLTYIAKAIPKILNQGEEWIEILHYRILNHPEVRLAYRNVLSKQDPSIVDNIKDLLTEIKNEDPDMFSKSVDEVISCI